MASARFAWGIDVGNRALKAVKLVREGDGVRVEEFEVIEHDTVLSNAGDNRESLIQAALANFVQRHNLKGGTVGVGVSGQSSFARFIKLPPVEPKKIPEIVRFEAIQQIPFPLDDVEWSYQLFQTAESPDVEVGIFAMRKELVNQHIKYFTDFDLNVQVVQMNPLAVYNALQHDGAFDKGTTMVIDLGAENTDLLIADNETIWMRSIPIGGNNFTETLVKAFKLPFSKAEDLKRNAATSKYARQIFQAMRPIFADLVAEIQRSIGFYASVHRDSRIKKVLALGGTFRLPGLQKYLQQNLQMDVERLDRIAAGAPSDPKLVPTFNENLLSVVSAYGLALQAMGDTKVTSSLLPAKIRREKLWREKMPWFAAAAALFVVGAGLAAAKWLYLDFKDRNASSFYDPKIQAIATPAKSLDSRWNEIENSGGPERQSIDQLRKLDTHRTFWRNFYIDLYRALPAPPKQLPPKRADRKIILIDSVESRYVTDFESLVRDPNFVSRALSAAATPPGEPPPPAGTDTQAGNGVLSPNARGFIVTLRCTTPYAAAVQPGGLVDKTLRASLLNIKPSADRPHMEYGVARVELVPPQKRIAQDPERLQKIKAMNEALSKALGASGTSAPPAVQPPRGNDPAAAAAAEAEYYKDPVTKEDVRNDWEFTLVIAVAIDPPPFAAAPGAPAGAQANAQ